MKLVRLFLLCWAACAWGPLGAQSGWQNWQTIYRDEYIRVDLQLYWSANGCDPNGKLFKFRGRINGALRSSPAYVAFKIDYQDCNGETYYLQQSFNISQLNGGTANDLLLESLDYSFAASTVLQSFYEVQVSARPQSGSGKKQSAPQDNMVLVQGGRLMLGCTSEQGADCDRDEMPAHEVAVRDFYISRYEVTQKQWMAVMGSNPSANFNCADCPVEQISWENIQLFIQKLNRETGLQYRLPTEAEWEYAARGGQFSRQYQYAGGNNPDEVGWFRLNAGNRSHPVGQKIPNELGLYDMSGNVWEWCSDWKGPYTAGLQYNPTGASSGAERVIRGGSWYNDVRGGRVSYRNTGAPSLWSSSIGFRLVRDQ